MSLNLEQPLHFHRLSFLEDGGEVVIGHKDIDSYGIFPQDGAALLGELQAGRTPPDAAAWYRTNYGQTVDMDEFLATLAAFEFIREDADLPLDEPAPIRWQRLGQALFSAPAWVCYCVLIAAAVAACIGDARLLPQGRNVFFVDYLVVVELTIFFGQLPLALLHELFHVLAARRLGLRSRVRLGQRLHFLVYETCLTGSWRSPGASGTCRYWRGCSLMSW